MINNQEIRKINKLLRKQILQRFGVVAFAMLVIGGVAGLGTHHNQASHAAGIGILSLTPPSSTLIVGSMVSVSMAEDSGTDTVNAVQASLNYDATKLQYISLSEGKVFSTVAATSTGTSGLIRIGRATPSSSPVSGKNTVLTITFKVLGSSGTTTLSFDPAYSFLVRNSDSTNILTATTGATYSLKLLAPTISSLSPITGSVAGGTVVAISGTNFVSGATVTVGGAPASNVSFVNSTAITASLPAKAAGTYDVAVINPDRQVASKIAGYTYVASAGPTITSVAPNSGPAAGGTRVTVVGAHFLNNPSLQISFDNSLATSPTVLSDTQISVMTPAHAAGPVTVKVTDKISSSSLNNGFTYVSPAPTISSLTPAIGLMTGGTSVIISGTSLGSVTAVSFDGAPARSFSVPVGSTTSVVVITPARNLAGPVSITITTASGTATKASAFNYYNASADANHDGRVNAIDLSILLTHDGQNYPPADFNGDGTIGAADMAILLGKWTW